MVQILRFQRAAPQHTDWTQSEIAEFYRVESALTQAGMALDTERGVTDEGDPWFAFCRQDTGEVFVHFARIDGEYFIDGTGFQGVARGHDFGALVRRLISGEAMQLAKLRPSNSNVFLHPAALLIALVGASFFHSGEAKAAETVGHKAEGSKAASPLTFLVRLRDAEAVSPGLDAAQAATVMAGVLIGMDEQHLLPPPAEFAPQTTVLLPAPSAARDALVFETGVHQPVRAAAAPTDGLAEQQVQPFVGQHTDAIALNSEAPSLSSSDADLGRLAGLMTPASPALSSLAASDATFTPLPDLQRAFFLIADSIPLPADEAGDVIRALSAADPHAVSVASKLPSFVEDLIKHGLVVPADPVFPGSAAPTSPEPVTVPTGVTPTDAPAPGETQSAPQPVTSTPTAPIASTSTAPVVHHHDPAIDQAVTAFMNIVQHWAVVVSGDDLVVYDADIFGPHASSDLDSVTFNFSDGSSISLVGTAAELYSTHVLLH
jgi:hypothetical protein